jgi:hypothetical protein
MGIVLPQVVTEDRASGAQVIDGSLKFEKAKKLHLIRTPGSSGNQMTWTLSFWFKKQNMGDQRVLFNSFTDNSNRVIVRFMSDKLQFALQTGGTFYGLQTNQVFRDNGWYHVVLVLDTIQGTDTNRQKIYVNGDQIADANLTHNSISGSNKYPTQGAAFNFNTNVAHYIGANNESSSVQDTTFDGQITNVYLVDGQALTPDSFGYTDLLTNTWRPKKYTGEFNFTVGSTNYTNISTIALIGSSSWDSSYNNVSKIFDGSGGVRTQAEVSNKGESFSITFNPAITLSNETVSIDTSSTYQGMFVTVDGSDGSRVSDSDSNTSTLTTGSLSGSLSKITVDNGTDTSGRPASIVRIRIGGSVLLDPITGVNGFYLPMDGNSPIGEDKSGNANNWIPVNFGGSTTLDKATGAKPILNTTPGGTKAGVGVFGSKEGFYETVSSSSGGGNPYIFDGRGTQPTLSFIRGATYVFDYSSATSHPLRFATAADAAGSTQYTDGTSVSGNVISFTVPHNAPDTLYYYCTNHSGMGNSISVTTDETKADQYASKCVLAMPLRSSTSDISASITCTSTTKTITSNGDPAASTSDSNFYGGSYEFDGTDDCLTSSDCGSGATEYTMECWFNTDGFSQNQRPINMSQDLNGNKYLYAEVRTDKKLQIREESTGSAVSTDAVFAANKWHHVAVSYDGVRLRGFVDGVFVVQTSANGSPVALGNNMKMRVGADESNTSASEFDGHIQDVRVYFGACKYTATNIGDQAFVVPATSPDILPDSPSGVATKSKLEKDY